LTVSTIAFATVYSAPIPNSLSPAVAALERREVTGKATQANQAAQDDKKPPTAEMIAREEEMDKTLSFEQK
jgi:hypothetical protein